MKKKRSPSTISEQLFTRNWTKAIAFEKDLQGAISNENIRNKAIGWLFEWAVKPTAETVLDFCEEYCIPRSTLYYWAEHDEEFKSAFTNAKLMVANRLYKGSLHREFDRDTAFKSMHLLDTEYVKINAYHAELHKKSNEVDYQGMMDELKHQMRELKPEKKELDGTKDDESV